MIVSADIHTRDGAWRPSVIERLGTGIGIAPSATSREQLTGEFIVVHLDEDEVWGTGGAYNLIDEAGCVACARKAAELAAASGVDWTRPRAEVIADPAARIVAVNVGVLLAHCGTGRDCDDLPEAATVSGYEAVRLP